MIIGNNQITKRKTQINHNVLNTNIQNSFVHLKIEKLKFIENPSQHFGLILVLLLGEGQGVGENKKSPPIKTGELKPN